MILVGITGGIGSGKSTVCKVLNVLGYPVYHADERAKFLMSASRGIIKGLKEHFGEIIFDDKGQLDRKKLAAIIFHEPTDLKFINSLVHPQVAEDLVQWAGQQSSDLLFIEAAILIESGFTKYTHKILVVTAPLETRIKRITNRDQCSLEDAMVRINNQMEDKQRIVYADKVITCDGKTLILPQLFTFINSLKK